MIRINLLGEEEKTDGEGLLVVGSWVAGILVLVVAFAITQGVLQSSLGESKSESARLESSLTQLKKTTAEVEHLEKMRKDLQSKLAVIAKLKLSKRGPVRVLDDLNIAIPERAWLLSVQEKSDEVKIDGMSLDNQTTADFMKNLEESDYFRSVELLETKRIEQKNVKMNAFSIKAKLSYTGKIGDQVSGPPPTPQKRS